MTDGVRMANLASLVALVVLSMTALTTTIGQGAEAAGQGSATGSLPGAGGGVEAREGTPPPTVAGTAVSRSGPGEDAGPGGAAGPATAIETAPIVVDDVEVGQRGLDALAGLDFPWEERLPGWQIRFRSASGGAYGYALPDERRIEIYIRADQTDALLAHVVAHELGHALDVTNNDQADRDAWREARGLGDDVVWWPDDRAADFRTGAGDFAECFAVALVGPGDYRSELGPPPTPEQVGLLQELARG